MDYSLSDVVVRVLREVQDKDTDTSNLIITVGEVESNDFANLGDLSLNYKITSESIELTRSNLNEETSIELRPVSSSDSEYNGYIVVYDSQLNFLHLSESYISSMCQIIADLARCKTMYYVADKNLKVFKPRSKKIVASELSKFLNAVDNTQYQDGGCLNTLIANVLNKLASEKGYDLEFVAGTMKISDSVSLANKNYDVNTVCDIVAVARKGYTEDVCMSYGIRLLCEGGDWSEFVSTVFLDTDRMLDIGVPEEFLPVIAEVVADLTRFTVTLPDNPNSNQETFIPCSADEIASKYSLN